VDADFYLDTGNGDVYQKQAGAWVKVANLQGPGGAPGTNGAPCSVWYQGSSAPTVALGIDGDYYLDTLNGNVYNKQSGAWVLIANLIGPPGASGSAGTPGSVWYDGAGAPALTYNNGDFYLDHSTGDVYEQQAGAWVKVGNIQGPPGPPGTPGSLWYHGNGGGVWSSTGTNLMGPVGPQVQAATCHDGVGAPPAALGSDGDDYLDTGTTLGDVYAKQADAWAKVGNIRGPAGPTGALGSVWYNGSLPPSPAAGSDGDYFLDTNTGNVYKKAFCRRRLAHQPSAVLASSPGRAYAKGRLTFTRRVAP
jgi:hypothetical protein